MQKPTHLNPIQVPTDPSSAASAKTAHMNMPLQQRTIKNLCFYLLDTLCIVQEILEHDSCNYNALVFEGFAREGLQQPGLALAVYRKALSLEPNQPLAWQVCVMNCFWSRQFMVTEIKV